MKWHADNLEGAFPLLLIGSVLVVYAGVLASQEVGTHPHLPLWGLLAGVGVVIVGAGIYSTFLEPDTAPAPKPGEERASVPRAESEARTRSHHTPERTPASSETVPIWWEGPPSASPTASPARAAPGTRTAPPAQSIPSTSVRAVESRPAGPRRSVPHPSARYSFKELSDELTDLEALVYGRADARLGSTPRPPASGRPTTYTCTDCDRPLTTASSASACQGCGRRLCVRCTASSRSEDGEVRCVDCRARAT